MSSTAPQPQAVAAAAHLTGLMSVMNAKNAAAVQPTAGVIPAAEDPVSALIAAQFAVHAQMYQMASARAAAIHELFVSTLTAGAASDGATGAADPAATP